MTEWPEAWLHHLEAEIITARSLEEAQAAWRGYANELDLLKERDWEAYNDAWLRLHRLARLMFVPQMRRT
jgi:hypothetical protein